MSALLRPARNQAFSPTLAGTIGARLAQVVSIKDFGAVGDGVTDDTAAVLAAHIYANALGAEVSYAPCPTLALQANAQIPIKTSTDFGSCRIVILGGVVGVPSFNTFNTLFIVSDDACPVTTVTGAVLAANLAKGALFPTLGLFDGHGFALLECALQVPNRLKTGTMNYKQAFKVNRNGRASHPLAIDVSAHAAAITITSRPTSKKRLALRNVSIVEGAWNNQRVLKINRCNVRVEGFTMLFDAPGAAFDNICELISIENAADVSIDTFTTTGRPVTGTTGSYCLAINGGADVFVDKFNALTGWGATGCNDVSGIHYSRSVLNRIDAHSGAFNMFADACDLHESGVVFGWGGGVIAVKDSRLHRCPAIASRSDYGATFFGDLIVANCEAENNFTSTYRAIDLETNPLGASTAVTAPTTISVSNLKRTGKASGANAELIPVAIKVRDAADIVYAPSSIDVREVSCFANWRFGLRVDTRNMEAHSAGFPQTRISFDNCQADTAATSATGVLDFASIRVPTTPVRPVIRGSNSENVHVANSAQANLEVVLSNCTVNGVAVDTAAATQPLVSLRACRLLTAASGYANAPIGGGVTGTSGHTILEGCEVAAVAFNLSLVAASIGTTIRNGGAAPLLPGAATTTTMFTGYRQAGAFS